MRHLTQWCLTALARGPGNHETGWPPRGGMTTDRCHESVRMRCVWRCIKRQRVTGA
jgi:hypothetical protein